MLNTFSGRQASQNEWELRSFIALLKNHGVRRYCEIGSRDGDTFHEVMKSLPAGSVGLACDLPGGLWGKVTTRFKLERAVSDLVRLGYPAATFFGDSTDPDSVEFVKKAGPFDAILLDGDHTYEGVSKDWSLYGGLAPMVAFHDIVGDGQAEKVHGNPVEVPRLWAEIKETGAQTVEFIAPGSKMGIGVVLCK